MRMIVAVMVTTTALVVGGCGGDDDSPTGESPEPTGESPEPASEPAEAASDDANDAPAAAYEPPSDASGEPAGGANTASITIGDQTFDFDWATDGIQLCDPDFFGGFVAIAATTADQPSFEVELFPEGTPGAEDRAPKIEVSAGGEAGRWTADPDETIGTTYDTWPAMVESFEIDGHRASGSAVFVGDTTFGEEPEGIPGSFEIVCSG